MATVKTISGISTFVVRGARTCGDYIQFPASGSTVDIGEDSEVVGFDNTEMPVSGTVTYNQTVTQRETMISQQGNNLGFTETFTPGFIEGEFYLTYITIGSDSSAYDVEITEYLTNHVDVTVEVTTRGGKRIVLSKAHCTMVQDVDMIEGTYSCRWEGRINEGALVSN